MGFHLHAAPLVCHPLGILCCARDSLHQECFSHTLVVTIPAIAGVDSQPRTKKVQVVKDFLGCGGKTLFQIKVLTGIDISRYSSFPDEDEVLLFPGTEFKVVGVLDLAEDVHMVQLEELPAEVELIK